MTETRDFWARRKAAVAAEQQAEKEAMAIQPELARQTELEEKSDAEILDELGLPDPDSLRPGDDFSAFMAKAVPDRIRRRALRLLWRTNPVLANLDELVDYGEDFTDSAMVIENMQTAYQVGKGMLAHIEKLAADSEAANAEADEAKPPETEETPLEPLIVEAEPDDAGEPFAVIPEPPDEPITPAPRRMTFTFEADTV